MAKKLLSFNLDVWVSDPACSKINGNIKYNYGHGFNNYSKELINLLNSINDVKIDSLENCLKNADFIIVTCSLNDKTKYLVNKDKILLTKKGVKIINIARGQIVNEADCVSLLESGFIDSVGFDVFEIEPLPSESKLRKFPQNIFHHITGPTQ